MIKTGITGVVESLEESNKSILFSCPQDETSTFLILCDEKYIISGEFCRYINKRKFDDEIIWAYTGEGDPSENLGEYCSPFYAAIIPVVYKDSILGINREVNLRLPKSAVKQLVKISKDYQSLGKSIKGLGIKITVSKKDKYFDYKVESLNKTFALPKGFDQNLWFESMSEIILQMSQEDLRDYIDKKINSYSRKSSILEEEKKEGEF